MRHFTYHITSSSTSGTARTKKGDPSISLDRARHSCQSQLGREILRTPYQQSWPSMWVPSTISTEKGHPTIRPHRTIFY